MREKPKKPYKDFPLSPANNGQWCKKIRGTIRYFGVWGDWKKALERYKEQKDDLVAGRTPRSGDEPTIKDATNRFLTAKLLLVESGEITKRTFDEYFATCETLVKTIGIYRQVHSLHPEDFEKLRGVIAERLGPVALGNEIQRVRSVFKYAFESQLVKTPVVFGPQFRKPSRKVVRLHRAKKGLRMFEAREIILLLAIAPTVQLEAMILLGINCGLGNHDIANLPISAVDIAKGWIDYPRPKTGIPRRCPLWPITVEVLREVLETRKPPKDPADDDILFITKYRHRWAPDDKPHSPITAWISKLLKFAKLNRPGLNFYALRHTLATIGGDTKDQVAVDAIMGHIRDDMASVYREKLFDHRLKAVVEHVRKWLFEKLDHA